MDQAGNAHDEGYDGERTEVRRPNTRMPLTEPGDELIHVLIPQPGAGGPIIRLAPGALVIGRTEGADVVLAGTDISRRHCRFDLVGGEVIVGGEVLLTDLDSTNGTYVDGTRVAGTVALSPGARVVIGSHQLLYDRRGRRELDEQEAMARELERANRRVLAILPLPLREGPVLAEWFYLPCSRLGGDAFGYRDIGDGRFAGYLLDVAGQGPAAAMHAVAVATTLRQDSQLGTDPADPAAVMARLDALFPAARHQGLTLAAWYWVYDPAARRLAWCAAGSHPAVILHRPSGASRLLGAEHPPIGGGTGGYRSGRIAVPAGATLYLFSDGAFDVEDAAGRRRGLPDLLAAIEAAPVDGVTEPQRLYEAVRAAVRPGPLDDDFSLVALTFP
jgi:serine phosphatase RsbU (regulator of sigma subunit)